MDVAVDKIVILDFDGVLCQVMCPLHSKPMPCPVWCTSEPTPYQDARSILEHMYSSGWRIMVASFNYSADDIISKWGWSHMIYDMRCGGTSKFDQILDMLTSPNSGWCESTEVFFLDDTAENIVDVARLDHIVHSIKIDPNVGISWKDVASIEHHTTPPVES